MVFRSGLSRVCGVVAVIVAMLTWPVLIAAPASAVPAAPTTRVLIIPGQGVGPIPFGPMAENLTARGYPSTVLDLRGYDVVADARAIGAAVESTRAAHPHDRIALVGHSIGAISARWYLKELGGADRVATYVGIGAPQYGSPGACQQDPRSGVCPGSEFMTTLNRGDDTPGSVAYYGVRSAREWVDGHLDGGQCRVTPIPANEALPKLGLEHTFEPLDAKVWDVTAAAIDGQCRGRFITEPDGVLNYHTSALPGSPVR